MTNRVFNIAKGAVAEKIRIDPDRVLVLLLKANQTEADMIDHPTVDALLDGAGNTEANFTNYARKTGLTATLTVDNVNDRVDCDLDDQTWAAAGGAIDNTLTKLVVAYEEDVETPDDTDRVPLTMHDFVVVTDTSDITAQIASGFFRAAEPS